VRIGAHVSAAGGLENAILNAQKIGADAIQCFGASPRQWRVKTHGDEEVEKFKTTLAASGLGPVFLHAPYLINLASPEAGLRKRSTELLAAHFKIAVQIGAAGVIFHIGSGRELPRKDALNAVIEEMRAVLEGVSGRSTLVIENSAGGGEKIGRDFDEIGYIMDSLNSDRVTACFDTAHAFEAGLAAGAYTPEVIAKLQEHITSTIGWGKLTVVHANDSKTPWNSHNDRHENIGKGYIGLEGFRALLHSRFADMPWLLEVPGYDGEGPDAQNIQTLRNLL
jgi:deoxyribonuclease IV